jgi:hypothetical protein
MDLFVVPTLSFRQLYSLLILRHGRRQILWLGVTANPSAEWMARQLTEACGWEWTPKYIVRDRDSVYGEIFTRRLRAMGIRDRGSIRRECLDHVVVFGERHLRHVLLSKVSPAARKPCGACFGSRATRRAIFLACRPSSRT